jgi:hypothetical protein
MTQEKFVRRCQAIGTGLAQIASGQPLDHWTDALHANPRLREVLHAQEKLLTAMERFLEGASAQGATR